MPDNSNYIDALKRSLKKKLTLLSEISLQNRKQREILEDPRGLADEFHATTEEKARIIDEIEKLDEGFEEVYNRVQEELEKNKASYKEDIALMQELIRLVMEKVTLIQSQEAINRDLMEKKLISVKSERKNIQVSKSAANKYYQNMMRIASVDPQYMDQKVGK